MKLNAQSWVTVVFAAVLQMDRTPADIDRVE
jgi:hypothetical protein